MQKNGAYGLKLSHKYDDIINMEYPRMGKDPTKHPRMRIEDRAKIFMPFAALKGHEDALVEKYHRFVEQDL